MNVKYVAFVFYRRLYFADDAVAEELGFEVVLALPVPHFHEGTTPARVFALLQSPHEGEISQLPKSFFREGSSRTGFKVAFESQGL